MLIGNTYLRNLVCIAFLAVLFLDKEDRLLRNVFPGSLPLYNHIRIERKPGLRYDGLCSARSSADHFSHTNCAKAEQQVNDLNNPVG